MNILLTNDDGGASPGFHTLIDTLAGFSADLYVCVPDRIQSARSMALSIGIPLETREFTHKSIKKGYTVSGSSVDTVKLAYHKLPGFPDFDLVVSGINHGLNIGRDLYYSSTVGAALEALLYGIPAIAVSGERDKDMEISHKLVSDVLHDHWQELVEHVTGVNRGCMINLNIPLKEAKELRYTTVSTDKIIREDYVLENGSYVLRGERSPVSEEKNTDFHAISDGCASASIVRNRWESVIPGK